MCVMLHANKVVRSLRKCVPMRSFEQGLPQLVKEYFEMVAGFGLFQGAALNKWQCVARKGCYWALAIFLSVR